MPVFDGMVVGAYAASPAHRDWDPAAERTFYDGLAAVSGIGALELPWMGGIHPHDPDWLRTNFPLRFGAVVTDIPHTVSRLAADVTYGLASGDPDGRRRAMADAARMRDDIRRLNDAQARRVVGAVELHTAPRGTAGSPDALAASLTEIAGRDWDGAQLVIEHCDTWHPDRMPEKGFLDLGVEIAAIERSGAAVGISLNWGRSVIEGRSAATAVDHARAAAERGVLRGFIASGVADVETAFGPAWIDAHLPFAASAATPRGTPGSLMTAQHVADVFAVAGDLDWIGVKVGVAAPCSVADRLAVVIESLGVIDRIRPHRRAV